MRFERFATASKREKSNWAVCLCALLTAMCLSEAQAVDCKRLKNALLFRNDLTKEGYWSKFCDTVSDDDTSAQFYCSTWQLFMEVDRNG